MNDHKKNAPVATHRDGAISSKVWRNLNKDGDPYYTASFQRTYTNAEGRPAETNTFSRNDLLKVKELASEAYRTIGIQREMDKENDQQRHNHEQNAEPQLDIAPQQQGLSQQRDAAMSNAAPNQHPGNTYEHGPERG